MTVREGGEERDASKLGNFSTKFQVPRLRVRPFALHFSLPSDFRGNSGVEEDVSLFARSLARCMTDRFREGKSRGELNSILARTFPTGRLIGLILNIGLAADNFLIYSRFPDQQ